MIWWRVRDYAAREPFRVKEYEKMLKPFFKILDENKILETL